MAQERLTDFEEICKIGEGSFGSVGTPSIIINLLSYFIFHSCVFKVRHRKTKDIYVLKKISTVGMSFQDREDARKEFMIHKTIKWDYIVKYEGHFQDKNFICILLEFMDGGDLGQYLKKLDGKLLDEDKIWDFFYSNLSWNSIFTYKKDIT